MDTDHVVLDTVKKAEDENAWIVRAYECKQYRSNAVTIIFGGAIHKVVECNLLEEDETPITYHDNQITFPVKPFKVKAFKIWFCFRPVCALHMRTRPVSGFIAL